MAAYIIADVTVTDPAAMEEYREPLAMRLRAGRTNLVMVDGVPPA